jgi:hypothetical protein
VEEQYYLLFPIFLLALWRFGRQRVFWGVVAGAVLSLVMAEWGWRNATSANFYLAPTRAWELLAGSICVFMTVGKAQRSSNVLSAIGLVMIVVAIFYYDENTPFPSVYALVPVVGTALIVMFAADGTWVARLLSLRGFVGIGLISYSAYLWHQPLFAFARLRSLTEPSNGLMAALAAASLLLAWATWYWVEQAFRKPTNSLLLTRHRVFSVSGMVGAVFVIVGLAGVVNNGFASRQNKVGVSFEYLEPLLIENHGISNECTEKMNISKVINNPNCKIGNEPKILLWGDSYAMHLYQALFQSSVAQELGIRQIALSQCMPNISLALTGSVTKYNECISYNTQVMKHIKESKYDFVVIASPFNIIGQSLYDKSGNRQYIENVADLTKILRETGDFIERLGAAPIFVMPPPTDGKNLGNCAVGELWWGRNLNKCDYLENQIPTEQMNVYAALKGVGEVYPVVDLRQFLCRNGACIAGIGSTPLYRDTGHFSILGSKLIGERFDPFSPYLVDRSLPTTLK